MKTELGYKYKVMLETITPVAIGNGSVLSPKSDYAIVKNNVCFIDQKKFERELQNNPLVINDYVQRVRANEGKSSDTFLIDFIKEYFDEKSCDFFSKQIPIIGDGNSVELKTCSKEHSLPLIPGSSLKGAIKSIFLFNWLDNNSAVVDEVISVVKNHQGMNNGKKLTSDLTRICERELDCVRNQKKRRLHFSTLRVSDCYFKTDDTCAVHLDRYQLKEDNVVDIPIFHEAIQEGKETFFELFLEENKSVNVNYNSLNLLKGNSCTRFFSSINQYSIKILQMELEMANADGLKDYRCFISELIDKISNSNNKYAILPLGYGKMNFYQSIAFFIRKRDKDIYEKYIHVLGIGKKPKSGEKYQKDLPLTRTLIENKKSSMGWVLLHEALSDELGINLSAKIEYVNGDVVSAKVLKIDAPKPFALVEIPGVNNPIQMNKTKDAKKNPLFKVGAIVNVEISTNKHGEIKQVSFKYI